MDTSLKQKFFKMISLVKKLYKHVMFGPLIFADEVQHDYVGGADRLISQYDYLNRSNRPEAELIREVINNFYCRYPRKHRKRLRERIQTIDDINHLGACFELITHELLLRAGCRVLEIEPQIAGSRRTPDFLAETASGVRFYLEATLATGRTSQETAAKRRLDEAIHEIDRISSPDFFLSLTTRGEARAPISRRRLRHELRQWISGLVYDSIVSA